jgi:ankyrin repeat protein
VVVSNDALSAAIEAKDADQVRSFLEHGADANARQTRVQKAYFGSFQYATTALFVAIQSKEIETVSLLLDHEADVTAPYGRKGRST